MTRMSDHHALANPGSPRIPAGLLGRSALARAVHDCGLLVRFAAFLPLALLAGCLFPPDLSVSDGDAGVNSPPTILAVRSDLEELPEGGSVVFEQGSGTINVTLYDTDITDSLYVRVFVDYDVTNPMPARSTCAAPCTPPCTTIQRSPNCDVATICTDEDVMSAEPRFMTVMVFDREPLNAGTPAYKAMPPGGLSGTRSLLLNCIAGMD